MAETTLPQAMRAGVVALDASGRDPDGIVADRLSSGSVALDKLRAFVGCGKMNYFRKECGTKNEHGITQLCRECAMERERLIDQLIT